MVINMLDERLVFDTIPEQFDKWRLRYSKELFDYIVKKCGLDEKKRCLEIGPGTGQATDFALKTGCDYHAIELGEHLTELLRKKYSGYKNFNVINSDFETYPFEFNQYDLVYSAAAIQWIDEEIAYKKCYSILKDKGYLAMFFLRGDYRSVDPELYEDIQDIYDTCFVTDQPYKRKFSYDIGEEYGLRYLGMKEFYSERKYSADEYVQYIQTHSDHIMLKNDYRTAFYNGIRSAIQKHGDIIRFNDTFVLHIYQKSLSGDKEK